MKRNLTYLFLLISIMVNAQKISLDDLIALRKKDIVAVEENLTSKGWSLLKSSESIDGDFAQVTFAYNKSAYDDKADSFIDYYDSSHLNLKRIKVQVHKTEDYNSLLARIKSIGFKLIDSNVKEGEIIKFYQGATTTIQVKISTDKDESNSTYTIYTLLIVSNTDYEYNFAWKK